MVTAPAAPSARRFGPRRGLPSGRAVVGAALVTTAAVGTFALADQEPAGPSSSYAVVTTAIERGDEIRPGDLELVAMDLPAEVSPGALRSVDELIGASALAPLRVGDILDRRDVRLGADVEGETLTDVHQLTIPVLQERAPGALWRGDQITLLAFDTAAGVLRTAATDAVVLDFEPAAGGIGSSGQARLTLALDDAEQVAAIALLSYDSLTVVLTTGTHRDTYPDQLQIADPQ